MPKHNQQGYAVAECTYTMTYTKTFEERYTPSHQAYQNPVHETKVKRQSEIIRYAWYAKCKKNQTNDGFLSRWYSEIVTPDAEQVMKAVIEKQRENNTTRVKRWEEDLSDRSITSSGRWIKPNSPPPPKFEYDEFDARKLELKRIFCDENEPAKDQGKRIAWIE